MWHESQRNIFSVFFKKQTLTLMNLPGMTYVMLMPHGDCDKIFVDGSLFREVEKILVQSCSRLK